MIKINFGPGGVGGGVGPGGWVGLRTPGHPTGMLPLDPTPVAPGPPACLGPLEFLVHGPKAPSPKIPGKA